MSSQVQALLNDVKARRESALPSMGTSPFPDFDRTLQNLAEVNGKFGGFSFNLDPKLAEAELEDDGSELTEATLPFHGSFIDAFPALRTSSNPPALTFSQTQRPIYDPHGSPVPRQASPALSYTGSFNPFAENNDSDPSSAVRRSTLGDDSSRKMSRFGFARSARQNGNLSSTSSPLISSTPLSPTESTSQGQHLFGPSSTELGSPSSQWSSYQYHTHPLHSRNVSAASSPLVPQAQAQVQGQIYQHLPSSGRFQPFDQSTGISEAALREFIQNSREQQHHTNAARNAALVDQEQSHSLQQQQYRFSQQQTSQFSDPAIMSASFVLPHAPPQESFGPQAYGPPPGLAYPPGLQSNVANDVAPARSPSPLLSSSDFPALTAQPPQPPSASSDLPVESRTNGDGTQVDEKAVRRAEKKAAATERAVERAKRRAEKEREKAEKKAERERLERERKELERVEKEQEQERLEREKAEKQQREREKARELQQEAAKAEASKKANTSGKSQKAEVTSLSSASTRRSNARSVPVPKSTPTPVPASTVSTSPPSQGPLLSKMPKKNRPVTKPIRIPKEGESTPETPSVLTSAAASDAPQFTLEKSSTSVLDTNSTSSRGQSVERMTNDPTTVGELLAEIERQYPMMDLVHHPFFDVQKLNPASKMTLEYGPLAHALSALSVGGGSFANNMPSGSVDNAVSSFQQLLETLTQTISDLLRLLPRTTWDDSSSFDGVLRDMLKGDDFLDDGSEDHRSHTGAGKDEVAALTLALERRARWMEVQLSKLEELHRDINTAAVRAVLAFNDSGWDPHGFAPRTGGTLQKFDVLGTVQTKGGGLRPMTAEELEEKLIVAKEAAVFAETEVREIMGRIQATLLPTGAVPESLICLM
jgi:CCR4-NOT transcription complex subunit 4